MRSVGRRDVLLSILGNGPRSSIAGAPSKKTKRTRSGRARGRIARPEVAKACDGPSRMGILSASCSTTAEAEVRTVAYEEGLPWGRVRIDEELCTACGTCVAVCPTGALAQDARG